MKTRISLTEAQKQLAVWRRKLKDIGNKEGPEKNEIISTVKYWRAKANLMQFEGLTLSDAKEQLSYWIFISMKIAETGSCDVDDVAFTVENMAEVRDNIDFWEKKVAQMNTGGRRVRSKGIG